MLTETEYQHLRNPAPVYLSYIVRPGWRDGNNSTEWWVSPLEKPPVASRDQRLEFITYGSQRYYFDLMYQEDNAYYFLDINGVLSSRFLMGRGYSKVHSHKNSLVKPV